MESICQGGTPVKPDEFIHLLKTDRVVAAVKDEEQLENALLSKCTIVFVLFGNLISIEAIIAKIKNAGKYVFVHIDLIDGLSPRDIAVSFIKKNTLADGIISTRPNIIKHAKSRGLLTVQRFFLLDSIALNNLSKQLVDTTDAVEILPGIIPKIIGILSGRMAKPIIAGGLISDAEDARKSLNAGAAAISTTKEALWLY
jgi:glycerol uptake operon antiterminator